MKHLAYCLLLCGCISPTAFKESQSYAQEDFRGNPKELAYCLAENEEGATKISRNGLIYFVSSLDHMNQPKQTTEFRQLSGDVTRVNIRGLPYLFGPTPHYVPLTLSKIEDCAL